MHFVEKSSLVCFKSRISAETAISENNMSKVCRRILTEWENLHNFLLVQEPSGERFSVEKSDQSRGTAVCWSRQCDPILGNAIRWAFRSYHFTLMTDRLPSYSHCTLPIKSTDDWRKVVFATA